MMESMIVVRSETRKGKGRGKFFECTCQGIDDAFEYAKEKLLKRMDVPHSFVTMNYYNPDIETEE